MCSFCPQDKHGWSWWMKFHFQTAMQLIAFATVWLETYHSIIHDYQSLRRGIKYIKLYEFNKIIYSVLWFLSVLALGIHWSVSFTFKFSLITCFFSIYIKEKTHGLFCYFIHSQYMDFIHPLNFKWHRNSCLCQSPYATCEASYAKAAL